MQDGHTHYTPATGIAELRTAVARCYQKTYGLRYTAEQVIISNGAKHSLHNALAATVGPGDEVIIPTPYWVSYSDLVQMTGATFVLVPTTHGERLQDDAGPAAGRHHAAQQAADAQLAVATRPAPSTRGRSWRRWPTWSSDSKLAVLSDEIYEQLVFGDARATCFATLRPELAERTITISGASKTYAMTGWRIGWALGPAHVIKAMGNVQSQQTGSPCSISQYAALAALEGDQECVEKMRREFEARRDLVCRRLSAMPGVQLSDARTGRFMPSSTSRPTSAGRWAARKVTDSASFCQAALESAHVNLVPGSAFGAEGYVRLSFATSREQINGGLDRLEQLLK